MRQLLKLQHHKHTGKILHHRHTSYRGLAVVFVSAGVFMLGLAAVNRAAAETFGVSAIVNVPVPSSAPVIASPSINAQVVQSSLLVTGSCPMVVPQVVVNISIDGTPAGTSACDPNNDFSVPVSVSGGNHQIVASSTTISGQHGPGSKPLAFTSTVTSNAPRITITSDEPTTTLSNDKTADWAGTIISSGPGPLYAHIDWGDGKQFNGTVQSGAQHFVHQYAHLASHNILLAVSDAAGNSTSIQYAAAAFTTATPRSSAQVQPLYNARTIAGLYSLYITIVCVAVIIWIEAKHAARHSIV